MGMYGAPTLLDWWLEALPAHQESEVSLQIDYEDRRDLWGSLGGEQAARVRRLRPRQARWIDVTLQSTVLEVFEPWAAEEIVYQWLWSDLKRINWTDGNLEVPDRAASVHSFERSRQLPDRSAGPGAATSLTVFPSELTAIVALESGRVVRSAPFRPELRAPQARSREGHMMRRPFLLKWKAQTLALASRDGGGSRSFPPAMR